MDVIVDQELRNLMTKLTGVDPQILVQNKPLQKKQYPMFSIFLSSSQHY